MPEITIKGPDGEFMAYVAEPEGGKGPGVLVIQEIFGVNQVMRDICDEFAARGYIAVCPDLFWRLEPGIQITDQTQEEWDKAFELMQKFDQDKGVEDLKATLAHIRQMDGCTGKVGTVGYCLGGKLVYMMACRSDADANVSYYGVGIEGLLDEAKNIRHPTMLHIAEEDGFVPKEAQKQIRHEMIEHRSQYVEVHSYPGCDHAFAREGGANYNAEAAKAANSRTYDFFDAHLKGNVPSKPVDRF